LVQFLKVPQWEGVGVAKDSDIRGDFLTPAEKTALSHPKKPKNDNGSRKLLQNAFPENISMN